MKIKTVLLEIVTVRGLLHDKEILPASASIVEALRQEIEATREYEPLSACFDGRDYWLFDGYHRIAAMQHLGFNACRIRIYRGSRRDALRRYIRDKLKSKGQGNRLVFKHCLRVLSEDPEWSYASSNDLSRLFGRKPAFFEALREYKSQQPSGRRVGFCVNKHGSISLF